MSPRRIAACLNHPFSALTGRRTLADLGAVVRFQSTFNDHDRELAIVTVAVERGCDFEWRSHEPLARQAGVGATTLREIEDGAVVTGAGDAPIVEFVRELCATGTVSISRFQAIQGERGDEGVVELATIVGYYTMLAMVMRACEAC